MAPLKPSKPPKPPKQPKQSKQSKPPRTRKESNTKKTTPIITDLVLSALRKEFRGWLEKHDPQGTGIPKRENQRRYVDKLIRDSKEFAMTKPEKRKQTRDWLLKQEQERREREEKEEWDKLEKGRGYDDEGKEWRVASAKYAKGGGVGYDTATMKVAPKPVQTQTPTQPLKQTQPPMQVGTMGNRNIKKYAEGGGVRKVKY